ncbi:hypothetical protein [Nocardia cyriacigeorgica]|uniref:hypothetical protein n=1 Tax=Nocardia cyriacigeorgica TaxID=135487 RepID=UPI00158C9BFA|nr:hypothetical protein [Nocardia cyriacigeorgica]
MNLDPLDPEGSPERPPRSEAQTGPGHNPQPGAAEPVPSSTAPESRTEAADQKDGEIGTESSVAAERGTHMADDRPGRSGPTRLVTAAAVGALVVALAASVWFGAGWVRAAYFTDGPRAAARDAALDAAQQAAINMTSMNLDDVPGSLAIARSSMTGPILASATEHQQQAEAMATQAGVRMESTVLGAALTSLNSERDRASALVVLRVTEAKPGERPTGYRYTWSLDMAKEGQTWKAEQVASLGQPVPLNDAGTIPADPPAPGQGGATPGSQSPGSGPASTPGESGAAPAPAEPTGSLRPGGTR